ncbi:hypothetical protein MTO96_010002 [Rhipicephalus appendiculatus]
MWERRLKVGPEAARWREEERDARLPRSRLGSDRRRNGEGGRAAEREGADAEACCTALLPTLAGRLNGHRRRHQKQWWDEWEFSIPASEHLFFLRYRPLLVLAKWRRRALIQAEELASSHPHRAHRPVRRERRF